MLHQQAFAYISSVGTGIVEFAHVDTLQLERGVVSNRVKQMDEGWIFAGNFCWKNLDGNTSHLIMN